MYTIFGAYVYDKYEEDKLKACSHFYDLVEFLY